MRDVLLGIAYVVIWLGSLFMVLMGIIMIVDGVGHIRRTRTVDAPPLILIPSGLLVIALGAVLFASVIGRAAVGHI